MGPQAVCQSLFNCYTCIDLGVGCPEDEVKKDHLTECQERDCECFSLIPESVVRDFDCVSPFFPDSEDTILQVRDTCLGQTGPTTCDHAQAFDVLGAWGTMGHEDNAVACAASAECRGNGGSEVDCADQTRLCFAGVPEDMLTMSEFNADCYWVEGDESTLREHWTGANTVVADFEVGRFELVNVDEVGFEDTYTQLANGQFHGASSWQDENSVLQTFEYSGQTLHMAHSCDETGILSVALKWYMDSTESQDVVAHCTYYKYSELGVRETSYGMKQRFASAQDIPDHPCPSEQDARDAGVDWMGEPEETPPSEFYDFKCVENCSDRPSCDSVAI